MKKKLFSLLFMIFALVLFGCGEKQKQEKAKISLEKNEVSMYVGNTFEIKATLENSNGKLVYEIIEGDTKVSLDGNVLLALEEGTAKVRVYLESNPEVKDELLVEVLEVEVVPEIELINKEISLTNIDNSCEIEATVKNIEANIVYEIIEGNDIIDINDNVVSVKGDKEGTAVVRVSVEKYPNVYVDVTVTVSIVEIKDETAPVLSIETSEEVLKLNWGKEVTRNILMSDVSSIDDVDGDITKDISISHEINNKKYGTYTVKFESVDSSGNKASIERTVEVVWDYAVEFIGHQGSYYGVANSEEAFLYAAEVLQYQALETDVKQTKDGVFVCCHDDTFGGITISSVTWDELKDVEVTSSRKAGYPSEYGEMPGTGVYTSKICTLERYLEICKEYGIKAVVELKDSKGITNSDQSRMPALMELIESEGMLNQTIFLASAYNCLIWVKQNGYDYIPCQYLVGSIESETYFERCKTYGLDISCNTTYGNYSNSPEWIAKYQDAGLKVSTYTYTQYVDYDFVQEWIDKGVDFVTCDWHRMDKLDLPENSDIVYHTVKFYDKDNNLLKETKVRDGRAAAAPNAPTLEGYEFAGWSESIQNVTKDLEVTPKYEMVDYKITYEANLYKLTKSRWETKEEFANDFYNDLFDWVSANKDNLSCVTYKDGVYTVKVNSTANGTATFTSAKDIKDLNVYVFEQTLATLIYKPIKGTNSADYVPEIDGNYFLNSEPYRSKYIECNAYFLKAMETSYPAYSYTYNQASNNRVQIFFRFHQWCNGSNLSCFNAYPNKYTVKYLVGVEATMPTSPVTYTIEDSFVLPKPNASIEFLGWSLTQDGSEIIESIEKGSTGNLILYAVWEEVELPDVYSNIVYDLDGGVNSKSNPSSYLEGVSTALYPASKEGYVFKGWSKEKGSNSYITSISELSSGEITLYANYDYEVYSIAYDLQGGNWGNQVEFTGSPATTLETNCKGGFWTNYTTKIFLDPVSSYPKAIWSFRVGIAYSDTLGIYVVVAIADNDGNAMDDSTSEYVITISGSYGEYASTSSFRSNVKVGQGVKFTGDLESGNVSFEFYTEDNISGGTVENYVDEFTIVSKDVLLPSPKMEGKVFKGWSLFEDLSGELYTKLPEGLMKDITLYAVFE